jgi:hypothetical protein
MAVMAYCGPRGIARSRFLSWPAEDQDAALAWAQLDRTVCKRCGTEPADWDPAHGGHREAFVPLVRIDPGCELIDAMQGNLQDDIKNHGQQAGFGRQVILVRREDHPDFDPDEVDES